MIKVGNIVRGTMKDPWSIYFNKGIYKVVDVKWKNGQLAQCTSPEENGYAHVDSKFFLALKRNKDFLDKCRASKPFTYAKLRKYFGRATLV